MSGGEETRQEMWTAMLMYFGGKGKKRDGPVPQGTPAINTASAYQEQPASMCVFAYIAVRLSHSLGVGNQPYRGWG